MKAVLLFEGKLEIYGLELDDFGRILAAPASRVMDSK
jgi:hypothetical protein